MTAILIGLLVFAYLLGAIPFGVLIARSKGVDILSFGSGNPGATNVKRALGWKAGVGVFVLDVLKGSVPALVARHFVVAPVGPLDPPLIWIIVGMAAVAGHCLSPFLGFKGGKGIATSLGAGLAAAPVPALLGFLVFGIALAITRYVSLASIVAIASVVVWGTVLPGQSIQLVPVFVILALFVVYRHRENIRRLRHGTESRFEFKSRKAVDSPASNVGEVPPRHPDDE